MNRADREPFPADGPFLPAQDAPHGYCGLCGQEHRLDLGCPMADAAGEARAARRMLGLVGLFVVGAVAGLVYGLTRGGA